jgi:hypothetical protein
MNIAAVSSPEVKVTFDSGNRHLRNMNVSLNEYFVECKTIAFPKSSHLRFVVDKAEGIISEYFDFPLPVPIPPNAPH